MKRKRNRIIITAVVILCVIAVCVGSVMLYQKLNTTRVNVYSVADLDVGDWQETSTISGTITNSSVQEITLNSENTVSKVYVKDGDTVKKGDKLLKYDMTLSELELDSDKLSLQTLELKEETLKKQIANPKQYLMEEYSYSSEEVSESEEEDDTDGEEEDVANEEEEPVIVITQSEIKEYVADKQSELKETQLEIDKSKLEISKLEKKMKNKTVKSKFDGTVELGDESSDVYITVRGNEGLYVKGSLNEYMLDEMQVGDILTGEDYYTGATFEAEVQTISQYPEDSASSESYDYSEGSSSVSYYSFTALITENVDASVGDDVELYFEKEVSEDSVFIEKAFVRNENGNSYVYLKDDKGKLKKQRVELGKTVEGTVVEIKSGITADDRIAFPYGNEVKEGARTTDADLDALYE